ncbi:MAG: hypothetical protein A2Z71_09345 [Chloroflexi bacterium RBG_13_50_21]|nr:MAG: hypothetical protein A2Z71_09345 [Chloroflexi bacterium RBG_13_50_21]
MKSLKSILRGISALTIIILILVALPAPAALADSDGPRNAGAGANQSSIGTEPWIDPGNITSAGSPYASVTLRRLVISNYLQATQYGFNIPLDADIAGIEVIVNRYTAPSSTILSDYEVRILKAGVPVGANKAIATPWLNTFTEVTYGGPTDLWGTTWTPADINADDFGAAISAQRDNNGNNDRDAVVDTIRITVYYGAPSTTEVACGTPITYGNSLSCLATVTSINGSTPTGTVAWTTDRSGSFDPNPCILSGSGNVVTCSATYTPSAVGDGAHLVTATYSGDAVYEPSTGFQTLTVNTRPVTVTADPQTKVFGDPDPALTYLITSGSLVFADTFTGSVTRDPGEDVGHFAILQGTLALPASYVLTFVGDDLTITKATPTCVVTAYSVEYDLAAHTATGSCTGVGANPLVGLDLSGTTHTAVGNYLDDPWVFTDVTGNYTNATGTVDDQITLRFVTVVADAKSKSYGQPDPALTYRVTVGSLLAGDAFSGVLIRQPGEHVGTYAILQGNLSLPAYYDLTYVGANLTIAGFRILCPVISRLP